MNSASSPFSSASTPANASTRSESWVALALVIAATLVSVGLSWDISWHSTIGRDTFWTPAHLVIYIGGASAGLISGWIAIRTTYFADAFARAGSVVLWGGRAPFGVWVSIWGAVAMLTSAPFDNWWHEAYGLDVKILSPPHVLLFFGVLGLRLGAGLMVLREQNRHPENRAFSWLFCWIAGLIMSGTIGLFLVEIWPTRQHSAEFFGLVSALIPFFLAATARASKLQWGATIAAVSSMLFHAAIMWVLPLFSATPKLGPIYNPVTHMVASPFPLWTVLPAIAFDLIWQRRTERDDWKIDLFSAALGAVAFVAIFLPAQWEFSKFYLSDASHNWFFAGDRIWSYGAHPGSWWHSFFPNEAGWTLRSVVRCLIFATISAFLGFSCGKRMTQVRR